MVAGGGRSVSGKARVSVAWLNGIFLPETAAVVPVQDRGFQLGDGVYETMRSVRGRLLAPARHAERLFEALAAIRITPPWNPGALVDLWAETLTHNGGGDLVLRTTVTRGVGTGGFGPTGGAPTALVQVRSLPDVPALRTRGISLGLVPILRPLPFGRTVVKTISSGALAMAREICGADEALLLDHMGDVAEGAASAIFAVVDGVLVAPPAHRVLPSVSRSLLAERVPLVVQRFTAEDLRAATAIVATNVSWGPVGVREFAGRAYPVDDPAIVALQAAWDAVLGDAANGASERGAR